MEPFLRSSEDFSVATPSKLIGILSNPQTSTVLKVELATIVDAAKPFVQANYKLEGTSDLLALECYEIVSAVQRRIYGGARVGNAPQKIFFLSKK